MDQLSLNFINLKPNGSGYAIYLRSIGGYRGLSERVAKKFSQDASMVQPGLWKRLFITFVQISISRKITL